jgi:hypothetical protein
VATGSLPPGLTLNASTGLVSGTPTATGAFTVKVTDGLGHEAATTCPITIQDFAVTVSSNPPNAVEVLQGYSMGQPPFTAYQQQTITLTVTPVNGFNATLTATCTVSPAGSNAPSCSVTNPITSANYATGAAVTITAGSTSSPSPAGTYQLAITVADASVTGLSRMTTSLTFYVVQLAAPVALAPGGQETSPVSFFGPPVSNLTYTCDQTFNVTTQTIETQDLHIQCSFGSQTEPLPQTVQVTIDTNVTTATLRRNPARAFAALWLGIPAFVLIGCVGRKKLSRRTILQVLGLVVIIAALLQGIACGGGFTPPPAPLTPTGFYQIHIVGKDANNQVQTSAVIPLTVGH